MVRSGDPLRAGAAAALIALFLLSTAPSPVAADAGQWHWDVTIPVPNSGMEVFLEGDHVNETIRFGGETSERLAGHHEWRKVMNATRTTHYEWHWDDNHTGYDYDREEVFDLQMGVLLGDGRTREYQYPIFWQGTPFDDVLTQHYKSSSLGTNTIGPHELLPESVLWGRTVGPWDAWEVPVYIEYCATARSHVEATGTWTGDGYTDLVVVVTTECSIEYEGETYTGTLRWDLDFGEGGSPIADNRTRTITYTWGNHSHSESRAMPAQVVDNGTFPLPFEGRSDKKFFAPRDQTFSYQAYDGLFPADPDPHAIFDIRQAGAEAVALTDENVRLFFASADGPRLLEAWMDTGISGEVQWTFYFMDETGSLLYVSLSGVKVPDGPLVVLDRHTYRDDWGQPWHQPDQPETAAPGDLARTIDQVLDARGLHARSYAWVSGWWSEGSDMHVQYANDPGTRYPWSSGAISTDATTGIVTGHGTSDYRVSVDPQNLG